MVGCDYCDRELGDIKDPVVFEGDVIVVLQSKGYICDKCWKERGG